MKKLLVKDTRTLLNERSKYQKKWEKNNAKYCKLDKECWENMICNNLINAARCLKETKKILHLNADIRNI